MMFVIFRLVCVIEISFKYKGDHPGFTCECCSCDCRPLLREYPRRHARKHKTIVTT